MGRSVRAVLFLTLLPSSLAAIPPRAGGEFLVNTYTTHSQWLPVVATDAFGRFVVVWESDGQDGSDGGIFAQRYDAAGARDGSEFQVNVYTPDRQFDPAVSAGPDGEFMVVWTSAGSPAGAALSLMARRYDAAGNAVGGDFEVNVDTTVDQFAPSLALDAAGDAMVVWQRPDGSGSGVRGRRFDKTGTALGAAFAINEYTTNGQGSPSVAARPDGTFVVVWTSITQDGDGAGVFGRRLNSAGTPLAAEFPINTFTGLDQRFPRVASLNAGQFSVTWMSAGQDGDQAGVFAQRFDALGGPLGGEFQVNAFTTGIQQRPEIAGDGAGGFLVVWESWNQDGSLTGAFGRAFDAAGATSGPDVQIHSFTTNHQHLPTVAADPDGRFVVAWDGGALDGHSYGVRAQRFGDLIFKDGVESGAMSAWSSRVIDGGDLTVSAQAALAGTGSGLRGVVDDVNPLYVQDDSPINEGRYRARFYLDPNGFDPGEAQLQRRTRTFIAFSDAPSRRVAAVVLRRQNGVYALMGRARLDDNQQADTGFFTISDDSHAVEIDLGARAGRTRSTERSSCGSTASPWPSSPASTTAWARWTSRGWARSA